MSVTALQIDFNRHILESIRLNDNIDDGLGIIYSDLYSLGVSNTVNNCEFKNNDGSGISIKQFGLKVTGSCRNFTTNSSLFEIRLSEFSFTGSALLKNKIAGIRHDPAISAKQQQEIAGWFKLSPTDYNVAVTYAPYHLPRFDEHSIISFDKEGDTKYLITERLHNSMYINRTYTIRVWMT